MPITHGVAAAVSETLYSLKEPCQFLTHLAQSCANTDGKTGDELNDAVGEASQIIRGILGKPEHIFYVTFDDIAAAGAWGVSDVKYKMTELSHSMTLHPNFVSGYNSRSGVRAGVVSPNRDPAVLTRPATRHATAKEDATRAQQGALGAHFPTSQRDCSSSLSVALPPVLKPAALRGALQISLQTVFSHELTHLFGALITGGETPDDVKARGYVPSAVGPKGERGTRFEELHLGGRLGAYFRTGREMDWAACCGLYLSKWSEETKKDERWTLGALGFFISVGQRVTD